MLQLFLTLITSTLCQKLKNFQIQNQPSSGVTKSTCLNKQKLNINNKYHKDSCNHGNTNNTGHYKNDKNVGTKSTFMNCTQKTSNATQFPALPLTIASTEAHMETKKMITGNHDFSELNFDDEDEEARKDFQNSVIISILADICGVSFFIFIIIVVALCCYCTRPDNRDRNAVPEFYDLTDTEIPDNHNIVQIPVSQMYPIPHPSAVNQQTQFRMPTYMPFLMVQPTQITPSIAPAPSSYRQYPSINYQYNYPSQAIANFQTGSHAYCYPPN